MKVYLIDIIKLFGWLLKHKRVAENRLTRDVIVIYIGSIFFLTTIALERTYAQDPQFSQFFAAPLYLNPAFTGTTKEHRFVANYRNQWRNIANGYVTYAFSYDYNMRDAKSGFGLMAMADRAGSVGMGTTTVGLTYSYKIKLSNDWILTPGLHFAYGSRGIDKNKVVLLDQLSFGDASIDSNDPLLFSVRDANYFDFGSGLLMYNRNLWFGVSAYHMNEPNLSMIGDDSRLPMKASVHGGAKIRLYNGPFSKRIIPSIAPAFILKQQGEFTQLDVGTNFNYNPVTFGFWYRGMPTRNNPEQNPIAQEALIFLLGMKYQQFDIGYSYDINISSIGPAAGGSHEVSLTYRFQNPNRRKPKVNKKLIPCPAFLINE